MSFTINLVDHLLSTGRQMHKMGRIPDALRAFHRLKRFRDLPENTAEELQVRLGRIQLERKHFRQARRHFAAALTHRPRSARYHYWMARACRADDMGSLERAARHYRKALKADRNNPKYLVEYGLLALQLGKTDDGLEALHRAAVLAPNKPEVISKLAKGLRQAGQPDEARRQLRLAMFRNPRDRRFRKLWDDFQIQLVLQQQEYERLSRDELMTDGGEPILLQFVPPTDDAPREGFPKILKRDDVDSSTQRSDDNDHRHVQ